MLSVQDFVSDTIVQIVKGIASAQEQCSGMNAFISPPSISNADTHRKSPFDGAAIAEIEFDIAVTAATDSGVKGGIAVLGGLISAGSKTETSDTQSTTSRLRFSVPVRWPEMKEPPRPPRKRVKLSELRG